MLHHFFSIFNQFLASIRFLNFNKFLAFKLSHLHVSDILSKMSYDLATSSYFPSFRQSAFSLSFSSAVFDDPWSQTVHLKEPQAFPLWVSVPGRLLRKQVRAWILTVKVGKSPFSSCELICVINKKHSAEIFINFKWTTPLRNYMNKHSCIYERRSRGYCTNFHFMEKESSVICVSLSHMPILCTDFFCST